VKLEQRCKYTVSHGKIWLTVDEQSGHSELSTTHGTLQHLSLDELRNIRTVIDAALAHEERRSASEGIRG
jgi:hypothetical protein